MASTTFAKARAYFQVALTDHLTARGYNAPLARLLAGMIADALALYAAREEVDPDANLWRHGPRFWPAIERHWVGLGIDPDALVGGVRIGDLARQEAEGYGVLNYQDGRNQPWDGGSAGPAYGEA